jgi:hypothetical protein
MARQNGRPARQNGRPARQNGRPARQNGRPAHLADVLAPRTAIRPGSGEYRLVA